MTDTNIQTPTKPAAASETSFTIKEHHGGVRYDNLPLAHASVRDAQGVLATATRRDGGTLLTAPTEDDLVTLGIGPNGMTVELRTAERMGYVTRGADGRYVETEMGAKTPRESQAKREDDDPIADPRKDDSIPGLALSASDADAVQDLTSSLASFAGPGAAVAAINSVLGNPNALPDSIKQLAENRGIDETLALNHVRMIGQALEQSIGDLVITRGGLSIEQLPAFWQHVMTKHRTTLPSAVAEALYTGDARLFLTLAREFVGQHGSGRGGAEKTETRDVYGTPVETVVVGGIRTSLEAARRTRKI
jgi:hypothetical protein